MPVATPGRAASCLAACLLMVVCAAPSFAALSASATISTAQTAAPFNYTVTLHNTGTTDIGTFWFAWTPSPASYDFLPTMPTNIGLPSGWIAPVVHNGFPGDGYSIEWYNYTGSNIAAGASQDFTFTSNDSPSTLMGSAFFPGNNVTTSFVYMGFPESDPGFRLNAQVVPEPTGLAILAGGLLVLRRRRNK